MIITHQDNIDPTGTEIRPNIEKAVAGGGVGPPESGRVSPEEPGEVLLTFMTWRTMSSLSTPAASHWRFQPFLTHLNPSSSSSSSGTTRPGFPLCCRSSQFSLTDGLVRRSLRSVFNETV